MTTGKIMYKWTAELFPLNRSITGEGVRKTLRYIKAIIDELEIHSIPSGESVFDWIIPDEWNVRDAYLIDPEGRKLASFKENNLHLVGYSVPIHEKMDLVDLQNHLYSIENSPNAIPYITSYYSRNWGFCIQDSIRKKLIPGEYQVRIDSTLSKGRLNYGEIIIRGASEKEILISTYICHPSMANNELSGPVVTTMVAKWLLEQDSLQYTYRIIFVPETIGSIAYISQNLELLKRNVLGGMVITCVGDDNQYSLLSSKDEDSVLDLIGNNVLHYHSDDQYTKYSYLNRGSDERQYSSVGVDIPVISLMRSKYGEYDEYHTSLDNMEFISEKGLEGGYQIHKKVIYILENNFKYRTVSICEPQLGKRGLYPELSTRESHQQVEVMMNILAYADGKLSIIELAEKIKADALEVLKLVKLLIEHNLIKRVD
jgi:aminopeptidase-like protein